MVTDEEQPTPARRVPLPVVLESLGALVILGTMLYLAAAPAPSVALALSLVGVAFVLWVTALALPNRRDAQHWERSAQVAFLVLTLGQVGTVASTRRAEQASERRAHRADSLAAVREDRADARAWARVLRGDSAEVAHAAQRARAARQAEQAAAFAAVRGQVAAADEEMRIRLRALSDSIGVLELVAPERRAAPAYERGTRAFRKFLRPRGEGTGIASARTVDLVALVTRAVGDAETLRALHCIERIASRSTNFTALHTGVWHGATTPDTMCIGWGVEDLDGQSLNVQTRSVSAVLADLQCSRWMRAAPRR